MVSLLYVVSDLVVRAAAENRSLVTLNGLGS